MIDLAKYPVEQAAAFLRLCRDDFALYQRYVHEWEPRPHQKAWGEALQALVTEPECWGREHPVCECVGYHVCDACFPCRVQRQRELLIVAYPGSGKTDTLVEFCCYAIGREPERAAVGIFSYNDNVATERSMAVRDTVWSQVATDVGDRYRMVFGDLKPHSDRPWAQERWFLGRADPTRKDPTVVACGLEGSVNARRLNGMVIDDPHNHENAETPYRRRKIIANWNKTVRTRLVQGGWKVCITPRWPADDDAPDLAGYFMQQGWPTLLTPALDALGESTWPYEGEGVGYSTQFFEKMRDDDVRTFLINYQGEHVPPEEDAELAAPLTTWSLPHSYRQVVQVWDTATGLREANSQTAGSTFGLGHDGVLYWLDLVVGHIPVTRQWDEIQAKFLEFEEQGLTPRYVLMEQASSGETLIPMFKRATALPVKAIPVGGAHKTKTQRVQSVARWIPSHVRIPAAAPWRHKAIAQVLSWAPDGRAKDDILMTLIHALHYFYGRAQGPVPMMEFSRKYRSYW